MGALQRHHVSHAQMMEYVSTRRQRGGFDALEDERQAETLLKISLFKMEKKNQWFLLQ